MRLNIDDLKNDLLLLKKKYNITLWESDQYDSEDRYTGTDQYFIIDGEQYYVRTVQEILSEVFQKSAKNS